MILFGFVGGVFSGLVGNGIDIITFSLMVLLFRISEKVATPTSVLLMALNAVVGFAAVFICIGWIYSASESVLVGSCSCCRGRRAIRRFLMLENVPPNHCENVDWFNCSRNNHLAIDYSVEYTTDCCKSIGIYLLVLCVLFHVQNRFLSLYSCQGKEPSLKLFLNAMRSSNL